MKCRKVKILLAPYILNDFEDNPDMLGQLEEHLRTCAKCRKEYQEIRQTIEFIQKHRDLFTEVFTEIDHERASKQKMQKPDIRKVFSLKFSKFKVLIRAVTAAACLLIGIFMWTIFTSNSKPQAFSLDHSSKQVAAVPKPTVKVELVEPSGNTLINTDQVIANDNELKTLLINGKHKMIMSINSSLSVEPLMANAQFGCLVKLDKGKIYTHVQNDGNPFIVQTNSGKAIITGTSFEVNNKGNITTLVVTEGTVRFKSDNGMVKVGAGQLSKIVNQAAPTNPIDFDTQQLTAWATGYKPESVLTQAKSNDDLSKLSLSFREEPIVLMDTDYDKWVEEKRDWFRQEFPQIFQLKDALVKEGIRVDYQELLIKSGDVWQFVCLDKSPAKFSVIDPNSLLKVASSYGFDTQWLIDNVPIIKFALEKSASLESHFMDSKAFERWLDYLDETKELTPPTPIYSYHAAKYLADTRSLIWFAVRDRVYNLTDRQRNDVLELLQEEVTAAYNCQNDVLYPKEESMQSCGAIYQEQFDNIAVYVEMIKTKEERIKGCEIWKWYYF